MEERAKLGLKPEEPLKDKKVSRQYGNFHNPKGGFGPEIGMARTLYHKENKPLVWPYWPMKLRTSSSHEEGCERDWAVQTKAFKGEGGKVTTLVASRVEFRDGKLHDVPNTEFVLKADLVLFAMGYMHPVHEGMLDALGVVYDARGNVNADTDTYRTSISKVFAAGDTRRGQSLVVWAIREGRQCARAVDEFLMGVSELPR